MGRRFRITLLALVAALAVAVLGAWAYDSIAADRVADGVRVGGVELGGLTRQGARTKLRSEVGHPLSRSLTVRVQGHDVEVSPAKLDLQVDVDRMADEAIAASKHGGLFGRTIRRVTGGELRRDLPARVSYSRPALGGVVRRLASEYDDPPNNADVKPSGTTLGVLPAKSGTVLKRGKLTAAIVRELQATAGGRVVTAEFDTVRPRVTTGKLARRYPTFITVDRTGFRLRFWKHLKLAKTYTISVGRIGFDTPVGLYHVQSKVINPAWHVPDKPWAGKLAGKVIPPGPDNPIKARWMGIYDGVGIHGTSEVGALGSAASHGCLRMSVTDVEELFDQVPVSTPIYIQ